MTAPTFVELTELQSAVLAMVSDRVPERTIAAYLRVDQTTVRLLMAAVCGRMHVRHRDQAVLLAGQLGLLKQAGVVA